MGSIESKPRRNPDGWIAAVKDYVIDNAPVAKHVVVADMMHKMPLHVAQRRNQHQSHLVNEAISRYVRSGEMVVEGGVIVECRASKRGDRKTIASSVLEFFHNNPGATAGECVDSLANCKPDTVRSYVGRHVRVGNARREGKRIWALKAAEEATPVGRTHFSKDPQ